MNVSWSIVYIISGGIHGSNGFVGCMRLITVDGNYMLPTDWKLGVINTDTTNIYTLRPKLILSILLL